MALFGLHLLDWLVIVLYLVALLYIGRRSSSTVHGQSDFFLAGRGLGPIFQFFLNFGNMTEATGAVKTSSLVYSQGVGGVWLGLQTLFMTPYYWFMNAWFRRARLTTVADLFIDRFDSKRLALLYAVFNIFFNIVSIGGTFLVTYKMTEVIVVKAPAIYTAAEAQSVAAYQEYSLLRAAYLDGALAADQRERFEYLQDLRTRGEIKPYVSYIKAVPLYLIFAFVVGAYVILGGMTAAAITDALQGLLIVVFSFILIPFGIWQLGGWTNFQEKIPTHLIELFGSGAGSEFAWYSILAILLVTLVQIHASVGNMSIAGSATDEDSAAFGAVSGGFMKRFMIIAWCFCGLIAYALFGSGGLSDPDAVWGALSRSLLGPGFLGLMLVGILAADMAHLSSQSLALSALFVRNVYLTASPGKSEQQGLLMGRVLIAGALLGGIGIALLMKDIISFIKMALTLNVAFGAAILVMFKWRRVTEQGVMIAVCLSLAAIVILPLAVPLIPALRSLQALQTTTTERTISVIKSSSESDVSAGRASSVGETITVTKVLPPRPLFFERLINVDPSKPQGPKWGEGRFNFELFLISLTGVDLRGLSSAQLLTITYFFDGLVPFILLFGFSLLTKEKDPDRARRFYVKMRTRVSADPAIDAANLASAISDRTGCEQNKVFPGSAWEFLRWRRKDYLAFGACCAMAVFVLIAFSWLLNLGRA